jgi:hypothetical protein
MVSNLKIGFLAHKIVSPGFRSWLWLKEERAASILLASMGMHD